MMCRINITGATHFSPGARGVGLAAVLVVVGTLLPACAPPSGGGGGEQTAYSGRATAIQGTTPAGQIAFVDTGELPSTGGALETSLLTIDVPDLLTADVLHAATVGGNGMVRSEAALANLHVTVSGHTLTADFIMSRAVAVCVGSAPLPAGTFEIDNLMLDGASITVTTDPNQITELHDASGTVIGRVVVNEQDTSTQDASGASTVNALHIDVFNVVDLTLFRAHADVTCATSEPGGDFLTGGGQINGTPSGGKAAFGVAGGNINNGLWGHLNYLDKAADLHVKGTGVTAYEVVDTNTRRIQGTAEINGQAGFTYTVEAADNGEPGTSDTFSISLSNGYSAAGPLIGGNIQLHNLGG